jgi:hypothetical protein|tara:strand:- start:713 stop:964 length:252 start_codon:yes stop_codon:yes gene_type:complete
MTDVVRISPESFRTLFLRKEDEVILLTEEGRRITIRQIIPDEWKPIRLYDFEKQMNENKREIILIDKVYRNQIVEEFRRSLRE